MNSMPDPFEPTPAGFHLRVQRQLHALPRDHVAARRPLRAVALLALCLMLGGTALAATLSGTAFFLTQRVWQGAPIDMDAIVQPTHQQLSSAYLDAAVRDAYWDGETLSIALHIAPKGDLAFYCETDRGQDGEHFDLIWWKGEVLPFEEWRDGRRALMLSLPRLLSGGEDITASWDWIQEEQGETMLIEARCADMTQGATLSLLLPCTLDGEAIETAELTFTLPPMTKGANDR